MLPLTPWSFSCLKLAREELNLRPTAYKAVALTTELRASSGAGGTRTLTVRIKSPLCSRYTTAPRSPGIGAGLGVSVCVAGQSTSCCSSWFAK